MIIAKIDMSMPSCCNECPFLDSESDYCHVRLSYYTRECSDDPSYPHKRPDWCPLIEEVEKPISNNVSICNNCLYQYKCIMNSSISRTECGSYEPLPDYSAFFNDFAKTVADKLAARFNENRG